MPWTEIGPDGNFVRALDARPLEKWLSEWSHARRFRLLLNPKTGIAGIAEDDDRFAYAVGVWARAWAAEIRRLGRSPEEFDLSIKDEPRDAEAARIIERWSAAIRASGAGFRLWTDPIWENAYAIPQSLVGSVDSVAINLSFAERPSTRYWEWMRLLAAKGKTVEIYACDGPARRLDPYVYYRLAAWRATFAGATTLSFWSLTFTGESYSDNEFAAGIDSMQPLSYSPFFINRDTIRPGKHLEAIAQGFQDSEYLRMITHTALTHADPTTRSEALALVADARGFIAAAPRSSGAEWRLQNESTEADRIRTKIGRLLDRALGDQH